MEKRSKRRMGSNSPVVETLEGRTLLSGGPSPAVYAPDANVKGQSIAEWSADWWSRVFETPVHAADGTTVINPVMTEGSSTAFGKADGVFFLYGNLFGGTHTRSATVPSGTPIFVPILPIEFSNYDTTTGNIPGGEFPGTNTYKQLKGFAADAAIPAQQPGGEVHLTLDGRALPHAQQYREVSPKFSYVLPADNLDAMFFDPSLIGKVSPAAADGYYVMLKPLSVGHHTLNFGATTPGGSLGPLSVDITYSIDVAPKGQVEGPANCKASVFSDKAIRQEIEVLSEKSDLW